MNGIKILKSSDKYLIFACDDPANGRCVYKIAQQGNDKLNKEVERLLVLKARARKIASHLPPIYDHGVFTHGAHRGKSYYKQAHVVGTTFSQYVQHTLTAGDTLDGLFSHLFGALAEIALDDVDAQCAERPVATLRRALLAEYERLSRRPHIVSLLHSEGIVINGRHHPPLSTSLDRILALPAFLDLDAAPPFLATIGHWNFHGDNVLLVDPARSQEFFLIDPDVTWDVADPLFSVARFLYTFLHDTADNGQYALQTDLFARFEDRLPEFRVTLLWPDVVAQNYRRLFTAFYDCRDASIAMPGIGVLDAEQYFRLQIALLLCLMRGVNANYEQDIQFLDGRIDAFRNKGIFLMLRSTEFADVLARSLV